MNIKYRPEIDGLRAISIVLVILFHYVNLRGAFVGVDIFFVISGYLITSIITRQISEGTFGFLEFYKRRVKRIFPALITVLISCLLFGWISLLSQEYESLALHTMAGAFFLSNALLLNEVSYFDTAAEFKPLLHLWSLSIEEQFYIIWPAFIYGAAKLKMPIRPLLATILLASFIFNLYKADISKSADFYLPFTRFWELAIGGVLYGDPFRPYLAKNKLIENALPLFGLALLFSCLYVIKKSASFPSWPALLPTLGAAFIISSRHAIINRYILGSKPLVSIGLISYPLYLWHWPILAFIRICQEGSINANLKAAGLLATLVLAIATYFFIEKPIRHSNKKDIALRLLLSMIAICLLGLLIFSRKGFDFRYPIQEERYKKFILMSKGEISNLNPIDCQKFAISDNNPRCYIQDSTREPTILAIGDSHSVHNTLGLTDYFKNINENFSIITQGGCLSFYGVQIFSGEIETCSGNVSNVMNFLAQNNSIKTVILSSRGAWYIHGKDFSSKAGTFAIGFSEDPTLTDRVEIYRHGFYETVKKLDAAHKKIIFLIDVPELGFNPKHCERSRPLTLVDAYNDSCSQDINVLVEYEKAYRQIVKEIADEFPFVTIIDSSKYFCDDSHCYAKLDGKILYSDNNHLSLAGTQYLAERIFNDIQNALPKP